MNEQQLKDNFKKSNWDTLIEEFKKGVVFLGSPKLSDFTMNDVRRVNDIKDDTLVVDRKYRDGKTSIRLDMFNHEDGTPIMEGNIHRTSMIQKKGYVYVNGKVVIVYDKRDGYGYVVAYRLMEGK